MKRESNYSLIPENSINNTLLNKNETISIENSPILKKPRIISSEKFFFKSKDFSKRKKKEEDNYEISHNDFSEALNKRLDEYSDDEFSFLKREIDSYINTAEKPGLTSKDFITYEIIEKFKYDRINEEEDTSNKTENKDDSFLNDDTNCNHANKFIFINEDFSIWNKNNSIAKNYLSQKEKIFIPRYDKFESIQRQKIKELSIETENKLEEIFSIKSSNSNYDLQSNKSSLYNSAKKSNSQSNVDLLRNNISNSSFSTNHNSTCTSPSSNPESEIKICLSKENVNFGDSIKKINKNLNEAFEKYENKDNLLNFKICHINSFCTMPDKNSIYSNNGSFPNVKNSSIYQLDPNKVYFSQKIISVNNNNSKNDNSNCFIFNSNSFYEINNNNLLNKNIINNSKNSVYQNPNNFSQIPIYHNSIYNNYQIPRELNFSQVKKPKSSSDPFYVLRESNYLIRSNGKNVPFEEPHNRINLENIIRGKDKRTTLMIRHIPNKYTLQTILEDINIEFKDKYDLLYLPLDFNNNCNLGFAFINFIDSFHILSFFENFRGKKWRRFNSDKICELAYAKFQGKKELINHFEKGSVMNFDSEDKKPLILPTPNPIPKISLPLKFLDAFIIIYPYSNYEIFEDKEKFFINSFYEF